MLFKSKQIKGDGRGHSVGFPTINLALPSEIPFDDGIYAVWVVIGERTYKGALHYGAIPTFNLSEKTLEVHLIDVTDDTVPETDSLEIEVDVVEHLREIRNFESVEELAIQIAHDVEKVNSILK